MEVDSLSLCSVLLNNFSEVVPLNILLGFIVLVVLLFISALISGAEIAFFSLTLSQIGDIKNFKTAVSKKIVSLLEKPKFLLATILISNNFVNIAIVIISTFITAHYATALTHPVIAFVVQVVLVTFLLLLMGEIIPKVIAHRHALSFAQFMAHPIKVLQLIFYPLSYVMVKFTSVIDKSIEKKGLDITPEDLYEAIELSTENEITSEDERKMLKGIAKFGDIEVKEIMKSRIDVIAVDETTSFAKLLDIVKESGYSRIPVFKETFDNISGILYVKDLLQHLDKNDTFQWQQLLRTAFFVPENKKIDDLLKEFQSKKIHLSIVVDEYGGTSGIVTLEDIIEEIVGEINDEFDVDEANFVKENDNTYIFEGKTSLNDFCKVLEIDDARFDDVRGDADSLAGLMLELSGKIPLRNESVQIKNMTFIALNVDKRRIKRIKVIIK